MRVQKQLYSFLNNLRTEASATITPSYLENLQLLTTPFWGYPPMHLVITKPAHTHRAGMKQLSWPIVFVGYEEFLIGVAHPFESHRSRGKDPTIQPTIV